MGRSWWRAARGTMQGVMLACVALAVFAACRSGGAKIVERPQRVVPTVSMDDSLVSELSESQLASIIICSDSLGMDGSSISGGRCLPCIPMGVLSRPDGGLGHARAMWRHIGRAPHDTLYMGANCTALAYQYARRLLPLDYTIDIELALVRLASRNDSIRALGMARADTLLDSLLARDERGAAAHLLELVGRGVWDRAQRMLERPSGLPLHPWESDAHDLTDGLPPLRHLPAPPRTSSRIGGSEAEWAARLFDRAATYARDAAARSRLHRLALAPWVTMTRWDALDSAATALLVRAPNDSAVLPARALAAYHGIRNPVRDAPAVWAAFDRAVRAMPRADSLRYDNFDGVLSRDDDEWRYGFLPSDRVRLDRRGWVIIDPLWSTAVNEVHLAKRARVAEADYRYADVADPGESGSESKAGSVWVRRGAVDPAWTLHAFAYRRQLRRAWGDWNLTSVIDNAPDLWRAFYSGRFAPELAVDWELTSGTGCTGAMRTTFLDCALARRTTWEEVPFWGRTDTIDVSVARFRAPRDSIDMYVGARVPLRRFKFHGALDAKRDDRIVLGVWFTTPLGEPLFHGEEQRALPAENLVSWTAQWTPRVGYGEVMHRVEALEASRAVGARGAVIHTSDQQVLFPLRGFGMSDVLVAAGVRERRAPVQRWTDLELTPNGAVVAPRQSFSLAWETYDLATGPDGMMHWSVSLHRETGQRLRRDDMRAVLQGAQTAGDRIIASEPEVPALAYTRVARPSDAVAEHLRFNLGDAQPGRHVLELRIQDLTTKRIVSRSVSIRVLPPEAQKRGAPSPAGTRGTMPGMR